MVLEVGILQTDNEKKNQPKKELDVSYQGSVSGAMSLLHGWQIYSVWWIAVLPSHYENDE